MHCQCLSSDIRGQFNAVVVDTVGVECSGYSVVANNDAFPAAISERC